MPHRVAVGARKESLAGPILKRSQSHPCKLMAARKWQGGSSGDNKRGARDDF